MVTPGIDTLGIVIAPANHTFPGNCEATALYTAEEICAAKSRRWVNWYVADLVYALPTVYAILAFIVVFAVVHRSWLIVASRSRRVGRSSSTLKAVALARYLATKHFRIAGWCSVSYGNISMVSLLGLFFLLMTFAPRPYYWPEIGWAHSPPLGTRTGWMALAILPFLMVMASKRNWITYLTGISHERLQFFHRWLAVFMLILGLIHTFAFVYRNAQAGEGQMMWEMSASYWTGVAALVPQTWLTFMSIAPIRNPAYELFKVSHRAIVIIFTVFLFLHCAAIQTSWHYFWALLALYGSSVLFRVVMIFVNTHKQRFSPRASIRLAAHDLLVIRVRNTNLHWSAGQHFFFRFTGVNFLTSWQSHPFTVCTVPTATSTDIVAVAKVREGEIKHLAELQTYLGEETEYLDVLLDGPYGDPLAILPTCDRILLLGGGSGLSVIVAAANELALQHNRTAFQLVATCRNEAQLAVYTDLLRAQLSTAGDLPYHLSAHVTEETKVDEYIDKIASENSPMLGSKPSMNMVLGRPDLRAVIRDAATDAGAGRLGILACGPESFMANVQDEVAKLNLEILKGTSQLSEVYLRSEAFSW